MAKTTTTSKKAAKTKLARPKPQSRKQAATRPVRVARSPTGLGLYASADFKKGDFIIEYDGPRITNAEVEAIVQARYLFEVNSRWTIDGSPRWNTARYINHSCRPNSEPIERRGRIYITAKKRIRQGEEITYNYGKDYFNEMLKPVGCKCAHCRPDLRAEAA